MLVKPIARTNFLGEVTYNKVKLNEDTDKLLNTIAKSPDDINISVSKNTESFSMAGDSYTVQTSKKLPVKLDGRGWKKATHTVSKYENIVVPKNSSVDVLSAHVKESVLSGIVALGERVAEHTGKNPGFLKYLKK